MKKTKKTTHKRSTQKRTERQLSERDLAQVAGGRKAGGSQQEFLKVKATGGWELPGGAPGIKAY